MEHLYDSGLFSELGELMAHDINFYEDIPKQHFNTYDDLDQQKSDSVIKYCAADGKKCYGTKFMRMHLFSQSISPVSRCHFLSISTALFIYMAIACFLLNSLLFFRLARKKNVVFDYALA